MSAVETHGRSWKYIQMTYYPSRAANHVKNRYTILSRRSQARQQQLHLTHQDSPQLSDPTFTPASSRDDESFNDGNEAMPGIKSHSTSPTPVNAYPSTYPDSETLPQQQSQWSYIPKVLSLSTESSSMFMPKSLDFPNFVPAQQLPQPSTKSLSPMDIDPPLDLLPTWSYQPVRETDQQDMKYFPDDLLTGPLSSPYFAPFLTASSNPSSVRPSSTVSSSELLNYSNQSVAPEYSGKDSLGASQSGFSSTASTRGRLPSISGNTIITTTTTTTSAETPDLHSQVETSTRSSSAERIQEASQNSSFSPSTLTLTIDEPDSETISNVMEILARSKGNMKIEVS